MDGRFSGYRDIIGVLEWLKKKETNDWSKLTEYLETFKLFITSIELY